MRTHTYAALISLCIRARLSSCAKHNSIIQACVRAGIARRFSRSYLHTVFAYDGGGAARSERSALIVFHFSRALSRRRRRRRRRFAVAERHRRRLAMGWGRSSERFVDAGRRRHRLKRIID